MTVSKIVKPQANDGDSFTLTEEMQQFIELRKSAGIISKLDTDEDKHRFQKEFNTWIKAGSPRPRMPELVTIEDPIPQKLYRIKIFGKQKLFWRDTKNVMHGKETIKIPVMKIVKDAKTDKEMEVVDHYNEKVNYTIDYTKELGTKLADDAMSRCYNATFYFILKLQKYSINSTDFNKDFDEIWLECKNNKYHFTD